MGAMALKEKNTMDALTEQAARVHEAFTGLQTMIQESELTLLSSGGLQLAFDIQDAAMVLLRTVYKLVELREAAGQYNV